MTLSISRWVPDASPAHELAQVVKVVRAALARKVPTEALGERPARQRIGDWADTPRSRWFVARRDGGIEGVLVARREPESFEIVHLGVLRPRQGTGRSLIEHLVGLGQKRGAAELRVVMNREDQAQEAFFVESLGFVPGEAVETASAVQHYLACYDVREEPEVDTSPEETEPEGEARRAIDPAVKEASSDEPEPAPAPALALADVVSDQPKVTTPLARPASAFPTRHARLTVIEGQASDLTTVLGPGGPYFIGRDKTVDLVLREKGVSRRHCAIRWNDGALLVEDLGSANGTLVNEASVSRASLRPGDVVTIGVAKVRFDCVTEEAARLATAEAPLPSGRFKAAIGDLRREMDQRIASLLSMETEVELAEAALQEAEEKITAEAVARGAAEAELAQALQRLEAEHGAKEGVQAELDRERSRLVEELQSVESSADRLRSNLELAGSENRQLELSVAELEARLVEAGREQKRQAETAEQLAADFMAEVEATVAEKERAEAALEAEKEARQTLEAVLAHEQRDRQALKARVEVAMAGLQVCQAQVPEATEGLSRAAKLSEGIYEQLEAIVRTAQSAVTTVKKVSRVLEEEQKGGEALRKGQEGHEALALLLEEISGQLSTEASAKGAQGFDARHFLKAINDPDALGQLE